MIPKLKIVLCWLSLVSLPILSEQASADPFFAAVCTDNVESVRTQLSANLHGCLTSSFSALHVAAESNAARVLRVLLALPAIGCQIETLDGESKTPLQRALAGNHVESVAVLMEFGADSKRSDTSGRTLMEVSNDLLLRAVQDDNDAHVRLLIPVVESFQELKPFTILHEAASVNAHKSLRALLETPKYRAMIDSQDGYGWTPLHVATMYGNLESADVLNQFGADFSKRDSTDRKPYDYVSGGAVIVEHLRKVRELRAKRR